MKNIVEKLITTIFPLTFRFEETFVDSEPDVICGVYYKKSAGPFFEPYIEYKSYSPDFIFVQIDWEEDSVSYGYMEYVHDDSVGAGDYIEHCQFKTLKDAVTDFIKKQVEIRINDAMFSEEY